MKDEQLLDYFNKELNPLFEKSIEEDIEREIDKELNPQLLLPLAVQREKKRKELLKLFGIEEKQKAFLKGLNALERLYPTVLDIDEQKRYVEDMEVARKKASDVMNTAQTSDDSVAKQCGITPYVLACMWRVANQTFRRNNLDDALAVYNTILCLDENLTGVLMDYGQCLLIANRFEEAISAFKRAASIEMDNPLPLIGLTRTYLNQNDSQEAQNTLHLLEELLNRTGRREEYEATISSLNGEVKQMS